MRNFFAVCLLLVTPCLLAQPVVPQALHVGVVGSPPFVTTDFKTYDGISVELWQNIAQRAHLTYSFIYFTTAEQALDAVQLNKIDVLIGPIPITAALSTVVTFTQPFYGASLGIITHREHSAAWDRLKPILQKVSLVLFFLIPACIGIIGILIWLLERKKNASEFTPTPAAGIGSGMWFALVTMTGVGYGDKAPITLAGRLLTALWMLVSIAVVSSISGGVAGFLTVSSITSASHESAEFIRNKPVGVILGTSDDVTVNSFGGRPVPFHSLENAIEQLEHEQIDAVVFNRAELRYYVKNHPKTSVVVIDFSVATQNYGFALPINKQDLAKQINVQLLALKESGFLDALIKKWT